MIDGVAPGGADPYLSLGDDGPTFSEGDAQSVLDAVERTYFQDD